MVKKGEVYWFDINELFNNLQEFKTNICLKKRPYLVVSEVANNLVTIVPIKSKANDTVTNIICKLGNRGFSNIIAGQPTTIDSDKLLSENFLCKIDKTLMKQVDLALISHFSLNYLLEENHTKENKENDVDKINIASLLSIDVLSELEEVINKIIEKKIQERTVQISKQVDNVALQIADNLEDLFNLSTNQLDNISDNKDNDILTENNSMSIAENILNNMIAGEVAVSKEEKEDKLHNKIKPLDLKRKAGNIVWDIEVRKQFLKNSEIYNSSEMCKLYKFKNSDSYHATLRKQKRIFREFNEKNIKK